MLNMNVAWYIWFVESYVSYVSEQYLWHAYDARMMLYSGKHICLINIVYDSDCLSEFVCDSCILNFDFFFVFVYEDFPNKYLLVLQFINKSNLDF